MRKHRRLSVGRREVEVARLTSELGFVYFVNNGHKTKKFADKDEAERYYKKVVEREERYAINRRCKKEDSRNRERISTSNSN
tara:strand:+ start:4284 stop:4529 length:246 start_codon:yes stop_codon:yes gene_type:complete